MHFQLDRTTEPDQSDRGYVWRLVAATGTLCRSPERYESVALARGSIAQFKRSASGVRYAKVVEPQDA